jgi:hypothetical protein
LAARSRENISCRFRGFMKSGYKSQGPRYYAAPGAVVLVTCNL